MLYKKLNAMSMADVIFVVELIFYKLLCEYWPQRFEKEEKENRSGQSSEDKYFEFVWVIRFVIPVPTKTSSLIP